MTNLLSLNPKNPLKSLLHILERKRTLEQNEFFKPINNLEKNAENDDMIGQLYQKEVRSFIFFLEQPRFLALKYFFINEKQLKENLKKS